MTDFKELQQQHEFDVYPKRDIVLVRGEGARVWDDTGRRRQYESEDGKCRERSSAAAARLRTR